MPHLTFPTTAPEGSRPVPLTPILTAPTPATQPQLAEVLRQSTFITEDGRLHLAPPPGITPETLYDTAQAIIAAHGGAPVRVPLSTYHHTINAQPSAVTQEETAQLRQAGLAALRIAQSHATARQAALSDPLPILREVKVTTNPPPAPEQSIG